MAINPLFDRRVVFGVLLLCALVPAVDKAQGPKASSDPPSLPVRIYAIGHGVTAPEVLPQPASTAPAEKRKAKYEGAIKLTLIVDSQGKAHSIQVIRPLGMGLDEIALKRVAAERFQPAMLNNQAVAVGVSLEIVLPIFPDVHEEGTGKVITKGEVGAPLSQKFSDWPHKPSTAILEPAPVCCETL